MTNRIRVVVTGMGAVTPIGHTVPETWENALAGQSGVARIQRFDPVAADLPVHIAAEVKNFNPKKYIDRKEARRMARCSQLALVAAHEALEDAGLSAPIYTDDALAERVATVIGVGMGGLDWAMEHSQKYWEQGARGVSPFALVSSLPNMPSYHVSLLAGAKGPITTPVAACATGSQAIGEGADMIRNGRADMALVGGSEGLIIDVSILGFSVMRALSTRNDAPEKASRPFDKDRDGFVMGEGAGILVLESLEHAQARGARIYGEVMGYASSSDAYHMTQPDPESQGVRRAIRWAMKYAGIAPEAVDYVNAHGTSTPLNDPAETYALKQVFGDHAYKLAVSSNKSMIGHTMGAAGAIEAILTVLTMQRSVILPTINLDTPDPECDLDYVPWEPREAEVRVSLKNAFGFGGQNACLILGRWEGV